MESTFASELSILPTSDQLKPGGANIPTSSLYSILHLPPGEPYIRVLDLEGPPDTIPGPVAEDKFDNANNDNDAELVGTLRVVSLQQAPSFSALSYVWGSSSIPSPFITCNNGVRVPITDSCFAALRAVLRHHGRVTIWVDAICINQSDTHEREVQVQLMGQILQFATSFYIWLGPGTKASDAAFAGIAASRILMARGIMLASYLTRDKAWRWDWPWPAVEQFGFCVS